MHQSEMEAELGENENENDVAITSVRVRREDKKKAKRYLEQVAFNMPDRGAALGFKRLPISVFPMMKKNRAHLMADDKVIFIVNLKTGQIRRPWLEGDPDVG